MLPFIQMITTSQLSGQQPNPRAKSAIAPADSAARERPCNKALTLPHGYPGLVSQPGSAVSLAGVVEPFMNQIP